MEKSLFTLLLCSQTVISHPCQIKHQWPEACGPTRSTVAEILEMAKCGVGRREAVTNTCAGRGLHERL